MQAGSTVVAAKFVALSGVGNAAAQAVVAAVTGRKIRVLQYVLTTGAAANVQWASAATALSGNMTSAGVAPISTGLVDCGLFETAAGEALNIVVSNGIAWTGHLVYQVLP
jgi:hypothetical protein